MELIERKADYAVWLIGEEDASAIYAITQTSDEMKMGDVFVIPTEGIVGVLIDAWPTAIVHPSVDDGADLHGLHTLNWESRGHEEHPVVTHQAQILTCCDIAEADANITGWGDVWTRKAESVRALVG